MFVQLVSSFRQGIRTDYQVGDHNRNKQALRLSILLKSQRKRKERWNIIRNT